MRSRRRAAVAPALAVVAVIARCGGGDEASSPTSSVAPPTAVVVDTDLAVDDLVALAFLLSSDRVDVRAITISGTGEVRCPAGLGVARALLVELHAEGTSVACGRSVPLGGSSAFPEAWRDGADAGWGVLDPVAGVVGTASAADLLAAEAGDGAVVLALGPVTNVAEALRLDGGLARRVASVVVMGGAVDVAGNVLAGSAPGTAEWNLHVDPVAAAEVLASGAPVLLVPLDATDDVPVTSSFLAAVGRLRSPAAGLVASLYAAGSCTYDGPAEVPSGELVVAFESTDPAWVGAVVSLTGERSMEEVVAWLEAETGVTQSPPGVRGVTVVPPGEAVSAQAVPPAAGVVCSPFEPGPVLVAATITVG